jgi:hypothetical protein
MRLISVGLLLVSFVLVGSAEARIVQAPNSRIAMDLPDGYESAGQFSGFINKLNGVSIIIVEMPGEAYAQVSSAFTPEALATRGVVGVKAGKLARTDQHVYVTGEQDAPQGRYSKFIIAFHEGDVTALITVNAPKSNLDDGQIKSAEIETALAGARVAVAAAPAKELFKLGYLGPFKEAASVMGTSRIYSLDGKMEPSKANASRPVVIIAPSLDKRPIAALEEFSERAFKDIAKAEDVAIAERRKLTVAGIEASEIVGSARDKDTGAEKVIYQVVLPGKDGGYTRFVGQSLREDSARLVPEFRKMAESLRPAE